MLGGDTDESVYSLEQGMECLSYLQRSGRAARVADLKARIRDAERAGDVGAALRLAGELRGLEKTK